MLLYAGRLVAWDTWSRELVKIVRIQTLSQGPQPMGVGAVDAGKQKSVKWWACGKKGHYSRECRGGSGGSSRGPVGNGGEGAKGKGGIWGRAQAAQAVPRVARARAIARAMAANCYKCCKTGHVSRDCHSKSVNFVEGGSWEEGE